MRLERLDLHGHTVAGAMHRFVERCNGLLAGSGGEVRGLEVVHGKGRGGEGGLIKEALREYLREHGKRINGFDAQLAVRGASYAVEQGGKLSYIHGEDLDGNSGTTIVFPRQRLPKVRDWHKYS